MKVYGYGKCSTCKKSSKYLDNKKVKYDFHDMVEKGMSQKIVKEIEKENEEDEEIKTYAYVSEDEIILT